MVYNDFYYVCSFKVIIVYTLFTKLITYGTECLQNVNNDMICLAAPQLTNIVHIHQLYNT